MIIILGNIQVENARQKELRAAQAAIPATEQNSEKAKTNSDGDTFTLNPIVDISGWQLPSEIDYDTLSKNISGAIVRVQGGSGIAKKIMQLTVPELINRLRLILKSSKNAAYP
ncbi:endolysin [Streptococcus troglodytae]|uniref:Endolysin n=1 Tax=Streptococcus troglodytae TaxID=1111760 RepID=A0A1L7LKM9_9STRE|nr:endolysin [Streptococcus troglodytae]